MHVCTWVHPEGGKFTIWKRIWIWSHTQRTLTMDGSLAVCIQPNDKQGHTTLAGSFDNGINKSHLYTHARIFLWTIGFKSFLNIFSSRTLKKLFKFSENPYPYSHIRKVILSTQLSSSEEHNIYLYNHLLHFIVINYISFPWKYWLLEGWRDSSFC
mgnify:CR=1 FL=1